MSSAEKYLKPEVIQSIGRLDLRAKFIVEGLLSGLHASPFQGFSVEFSEHRRYEPGDDPRDIDWQVFARTDRIYIRRYQAETNITGYLLMDLSRSMGYTWRQKLTKFDYSVCLAAALSYLMIHQQDPVGLMTFGDRLQASLPARSRRSQFGDILSVLQQCQPTGGSQIAACLRQAASMIRHRSLLMLMSDLLADPDEILEALRAVRFRGHDVILFHILDEAEATFPFSGAVDLLEPEQGENEIVDAASVRADYLQALAELRERYRTTCLSMGADYVPLDTSMPFDKALVEYLSQRQARF
ncbi:MAG: DUF58 domain-containing protein [Planctomyces sp.]|jgi:uncharacterized protein (DUF58 family)|nr:DUF58 domain-containing protein [Planctomyces sp.]GDX94107.1 hypothetical protein LBMAG46_41170 [Planctomycetia bacterium]HAV31888.1 DUF58 domain-containing protein [Planctomycetaceae bacterium]HBC63670.1 DUF58 domain-containing protein [Planctomycetaceae bacterium]